MSERKAGKPLPSPEEISKLPPDGGAEFNRLIHEKSPYLLQHARNPVDWYPWAAEAFKKAEKENKPVFLSIGYSTCHWCHVMEGESFENEEVAALLNRHYVSIKVDREERPDIDEIYMNATQLITGRGGWPNSVWLLADGRPWYAGTYFPREDGHERPGFKTILSRLADFWHTRPDDVDNQANQLSEVMKRISSGSQVEGSGELTRDLADQAVAELKASFDQRFGGFGDAPKFPPHTSLRLILYEYRRTKAPALLEMAVCTLDAMVRGGIRDHVGGGFHRYSTDAVWLLPHFEKMLYDNAQLSRAYLEGYLLTGKEDYREAAVEAYEWVLRDMADEKGGFYSALDADSEGVEGKFYVWSREEILEVLGDEEGELFSRAYDIRSGGNFTDEATGKAKGVNIPHLERSLGEIADDEGMAESELRARLKRSRRKLLERRTDRIWPHLDDKVLAGWNGLMIGSLAYAGRHLNEPRYRAAAEKAAAFILKFMRKNGRLLRTYREGEAKLNAYLDDYAFLADGLLELHETTRDDRWLEEAKALVEVLLAHYRDEANGGLFFTSADHETLLTRSKDPLDKAIPSGNGVAAQVLVRLGELTGNKKYLEMAKSSFEAFLGIMERAPHGTESMILALARSIDGIPIAGEPAAASQIPDAVDARPDASARKKPVSADAFLSHLRPAPGETFHVALRLWVDEGWHVNSRSPLQDYLIPTSVTLKKCAFAEPGEITYPLGKETSFAFSEEPLSVYEGAVWILMPVTVSKDAGEGEASLTLGIRFQACDDQSCSAPADLDLSIPIQIHAAGGGGAIRHGRIFKSFGVYDRRA